MGQRSFIGPVSSSQMRVYRRAGEALQTETILLQMLKTAPISCEAWQAQGNMPTAQRYRVPLDLGTAKSPTIQSNL